MALKEIWGKDDPCTLHRLGGRADMRDFRSGRRKDKSDDED